VGALRHVGTVRGQGERLSPAVGLFCPSPGSRSPYLIYIDALAIYLFICLFLYIRDLPTQFADCKLSGDEPTNKRA
jgi:hypothetical protein